MYSMLLGLTFVVAAPAIKPKSPPETIVGEWLVESVQVGEQPSTSKEDTRWIFRDDGTMSILSVGATASNSKYSLNSKDNDWLDLASEKDGSLTHQCRYSLQGGTLTLSVGHDRNRRPDNLNPSPRATVWIMKRVKPGGEK